MRKYVVAIMLTIAGPAAAQDPINVRLCEAAVLQVIKTPATYRRADVERYEEDVTLIFDAQNVFGALVRSRAQCSLLPLMTGDNGIPQIGGLTIDGRPVQTVYLARVVEPAARRIVAGAVSETTGR